MKGSEFNEKYPDTLFAVFSNSADLDMTSNNHSFERINVNSIVNNAYIYIVNIPDDCIITSNVFYRNSIMQTEYTSTNLIINYPVHRDYFEIIGDNYALDSVKHDGYLLQYVKYKTPEICLAAVQQDGWALQFVKEQTHEICLAAVQKCEWAIKFVKEQTPELCLAAVQNRGWALIFVKEQTPEICLAAVQKDGCALEFVKEQTPEICLAAVQNYPESIYYVNAQFTHLFGKN